jgi:N-acetylglutamate synthase-like GNAT family acetyltransferase
MEYELREKTNEDNTIISKLIKENWGSEKIVTKGKIYDANILDGIIASIGEDILGIGLYIINNKECEIIVLQSFKENIGIGTNIINSIKEKAKNNNCKRLWLITTNDNIEAIKYYQRRGFIISNIYINSIEDARKLKPQIPKIGNYNIPIRDEIEFEIVV